MRTSHLLDGLNEAQRRAVTHEAGHLLVIAGAGTGKTMTLASRVAHLIASGATPSRILLLTFTRRAAEEMLRRAGSLAGPAAAAQVAGGTFHAVANRLLRRYGSAAGLPPGFSVLDQADAADVIDLVRAELGLGAAGGRRFPRKATLADIYSRTVNTQNRLTDVLDSSFPWCKDEADGIRQIFESYVARKRAQHLLDYDDLLLFWRAIVDAPGAQPIGSLFDHILVDEYQDTNALQADIVAAMAAEGARVTAVGDDAQAIYAFRAATVRNILEFPQRFAPAEVVTLEENYRSSQPILDVANTVIAQASEGYRKQLWSTRPGSLRPQLVTCADETAQCDAVCTQVLDHLEAGTLLQRQSVLFRTGHHSDALEIELARRNIPFVKYGGLKYLEAAHVKDVLAMLRILDNPRDEVAWFRVLRLAEGVGAATARRILAAIEVHDPSVRPFSRLAQVRTAPEELRLLGRVLVDADDDGLAVAAQIQRMRAFLDPALQRAYDNAAARLSDLDRLMDLAGTSRSRSAFLSDIVLDPPAATGDLAGPPLLDEDYLILSTIHSAKGCEWDVVHVIHAADGMMPSDMATGSEEEIAEERRLLYVALTRARDALHVYFPMRYHFRGRPMGDEHGYAQLSRFFTPPAVACLDRRTWGRSDPGELEVATTAGDGSAARSVDAFLNKLWS